jgi:hypothetical protein
VNLHPVILLATVALSPLALAAAPEALTPPPQDRGLPYTRSSIPAALKALGDGIAVFPGSRYGYVDGARVRLSETDLLRGTAIARDGELFVPASFARLLGSRQVPPPVPADLAPLADRWVYRPSELQSGTFKDADVTPSVEIRGEPYVSFQTAAKASGLEITSHPSGLLVARKSAWTPPSDPGVMESIVTLFDTPESFADPDIATKIVPLLTRQGKWTDHVKVSPEQKAALDGPPTEWEWTPTSAYNETAINKSMFGSTVPAPGVYPRLLFSEADLPAVRERVKATRTGRKALVEMEELFRKSWWDPSTTDGQIFQKLSSGQLDGLERPDGVRPEQVGTFATSHTFKGQKPGIYYSHVAYVPECLTAMALYCLVTGDDERGRQAAAAIANYYKLREPLIDRWLEVSDSEFGSSLRLPDGSLDPLNGSGARTHWRNIHGLVAHMNLGLSLDLAGRWMTAEQKDTMRRVIAKATYGRRSHGQDGPVRVRDVNWMAWDLTHFLAVAAIEGLPGFDEEAFAVGKESVRAFCEWGIDPSGVIFESNGKTGGGLQFQLLSMVVTARHGENLFAHPHWRRLLEGQVQMTSPNGRVIPNSGTQFVPHSREALSASLLPQWKSFYPQSRLPDYLATAAGLVGTRFPGPDFDAEAHRKKAAADKRLRLPSITYPGFVAGVLFDTDLETTARADLELPLDFDAATHGVFSAYSDRTPDAAWMNMMVRPNHYIGAGHHHSDAGMFHFSALGVDWFTESPFSQVYSGNVHNLVMVDGLSQAGGLDGGVPGVSNGYSAAATYLGAASSPDAALASADLTYAYAWRWNTQPPPAWTGPWEALEWEMDPSPEITRIFAGTARVKWRPWWPNYNSSNYIATSRAPFNPMEHVFRTVGLVRGKHPWGFVVDDVKKDDTTRLYQWTAMLNGGVWHADLPGLPPNAVALASTGTDSDPKSPAPPETIKPASGAPLLLLVAAGMEPAPGSDLPLIEVKRIPAPPAKDGQKQFLNQLVINHRGTSAAFRVLLLPLRAGDPLPQIASDAAASRTTVSRPGSEDALDFHPAEDGRTRVRILRNGQPIGRELAATIP